MRMACQGIKINKILAFDMIPGISWDYKPQIPLPVAFSYSRSREKEVLGGNWDGKYCHYLHF